MSGDLKILADNRDALLLAEIAAWLHMFGKLQEKFLEGSHDLDSKIPEEVLNIFPQLADLLQTSWTGKIWSRLPMNQDLRAGGLSISSLITRHRNRLRTGTEGFVKLIVDAHGRGSGIEKGSLDELAKDQGNPVFLSTSLGHEIPIKPTELQKAQRSLYSYLEMKLGELKTKNANLSLEEWGTFRDEFLREMKESFYITVAETRRPLNDVTLFDQTAISVAFFKAALAQNLLLGQWKDPLQKNVSDKYKWRLLRIGLDGLSFWGDSIRVGDLLARKELIDDALNRVQYLLEVFYPLGYEVYRDENGSIFIIPDIDDLLLYTDNRQSLEKQIQIIANEKFGGEVNFTLSISNSTRDTLLFGRLATLALPWPVPQLTWLQQQWIGQKRDICPVCGLRPQGPGKKALSRKVCNICEERRSERSKDWMKNPSTTIWIDEVADINGQLALLVARFDVADWLSGNSFNTILAVDPVARLIQDENRESQHKFDLEILNENIKNGLMPGKEFEDNLLGYLVSGEQQRGGSNFVQDFYDLHVTHADLGTISSELKPELLTLSMIRQSPSFARISRTWETTKKFWEEIEFIFNNSVGKVGTRLRILGTFIPNTRSRDTLGISHTYDLKLGNVNLSVTCVNEGEFLTVDNLYRVAVLLGAQIESRDYTVENYNIMAGFVRDNLQRQESFELEEPAGYGESNIPLGQILIRNVLIEDREPYLPTVTILTEPRILMALAPATKVLEIAQAIEKKYEKEMSKVRNRFSISLGIIFAGSRTPLPAILSAGRRMLKQPIESENWTIKSIASASQEVALTLEKGWQTLSLKVPVFMGDGITLDAWYPYWRVEKDKDNMKPSGRTRQFIGVDGKDWVHICDLHEGDVVQFTPSRFDFEFLDTASRRFEVSYDHKIGKRRGSYHPDRPYYLEQLDEIEGLWKLVSRSLTTSQIHDLISTIETKRVEWLAHRDDITFQNMVRDALNNASWKFRPGEGEFKNLEQAALSGQLADVIELHLYILKDEPEADKIGGNS